MTLTDVTLTDDIMTTWARSYTQDIAGDSTPVIALALSLRLPPRAVTQLNGIHRSMYYKVRDSQRGQVAVENFKELPQSLREELWKKLVDVHRISN